MADSPGSPLTSIASDELTEDVKLDKDEGSPPPASASQPPSKRRRTGVATWDAAQTPLSSVNDNEEPVHVPTSPSTSISSDTDGSIPYYESSVWLYDQDPAEQVSVCRWDGCDAGDLGNMDALVKHIHNDHIGTRQKKYSCEWIDCPRKGQTHASGYALRAHMRSHTREKPFYCALPECDRSFTRSDALAKHMRTVHETDPLRPSDPVPKGQSAASEATGTPTSKVQRIKLKLSFGPRDDTEHNQQQQQQQHQTAANGEPASTEAEDLDGAINFPEFGPDLGFDEHELSMRPRDLYRLLRRQIHWAEIETAKLQEEWARIEPRRKRAWCEKEAVFKDLEEAERRLLALTEESRAKNKPEVEQAS
ncbi:hypothetical protein VTN49DRAFT_7697 [Thermomyces lanuginosus]|uniref:uncharacterized protein n=1 Tax=Thermomyces lanuginosus TaxID=5541 RepID=UPI00374249D8